MKNLITITDSLVERYNQCLKTLGIKPTKLLEFTIDLFGWSPEIATEKNDKDYLLHGNNMPFGIIVTPEQQKSSLVYDHTSFLKDVMKNVFATYQKEIDAMSIWTSLIVSIGNSNMAIQTDDILLWNSLTISIEAPYNIQQAAKEQNNLVEQFQKDDNFLDNDLQEKIILSAKMHGDLRNKPIKLPSLTILVKSFYTNLFDGIFVFRNPNMKPLVVFMNKKSMQSQQFTDVICKYIQDTDILIYLKKYDMLSIVINEEKIVSLSNNVFADIVSKKISKKDKSDTISDVLHNPALKQKYYEKYKDELQRCVDYKYIYNNFRKLTPNALRNLLEEKEVLEYFYEPHISLLPNEQEVLWKLLTTCMPLVFIKNTESVSF